MVYRAIGLMSGSSLDGLDIAFAHFQENAGKWSYEIKKADCFVYDLTWKKKLQSALHLSALDYQLLHIAYGHYLGQQVNRFINENNLSFQVQFIASHGHTVFHEPDKKMTAQLGDGASIAAVTGINVVSNLRAMDMALGGQGAPIVPIGEKLLLGEYDFFLNLGGIANISYKQNDNFTAFDVCPANSILNMLSNELGKDFDEGGAIASKGNINEQLLKELNGQDYYTHVYPKSLSNNFGTQIIYPLIKQSGHAIEDALRTYVEHIVQQVNSAVNNLVLIHVNRPSPENRKLLVTGGGAFNKFLIDRLKNILKELHVEVIVPGENIIQYKEALIMAFIGVLRWREENNVLASVTGASRNSIGGEICLGLEA
jgi:anhydro-N-acetylmuramic acid kinase